ncbi:AMP-binding protein [Azotobacter beijerinckii]|uniref:Cyclohexanecarboxylate-CoA ligase n=1 Tax=Azotobacter beijerinckii TaxID=170623 RepID=A0A1I3ZH39_9GAMM|nr:AMP-binding protein [Azotobacter beijerinckii]SFB32514.1 cyclohexanecarboxylate-CoA ligase [Azotobacter beijerinckii]SFK43312.1 cyclohexanecarboxylate-CoA ligase [Azotobacter beijerinckii]
MKVATNMHERRRAEMYACGAWKDMIITDYLDRAVAATPHKTALVGYRVQAGDRTVLTYGELNQRVTRMAAGLAALGVGPGDVVSCQLPNWWQMNALFLACVRIGAVINPLMPIFREHELRFMLAHARSRVLVIPQTFRHFDHRQMIQGLRGELPNLAHVLVVEGDGEQSFERVLLERAWETECDTGRLFAERRPSPDDVVQVIYTSGTTGKPKGVMHTCNTLLSHIRPFCERHGLSEGEGILMPSPLAHQLGFLYGLMTPVYLGASVILQDVWNPLFAVQIIAEERPGLTLGSTPFLADLVEVATEHHQQLSSLKTFISAGAPIPGALVEKAASLLDTRIVSAWGMTENGAVTTTRPEDPMHMAVISDGLALPYMEVKVVGEEGQELPANQEGDLLVRGSSQFVGYLNQPELYNVDAEGWFPTGDIARMSADGYIRITGRSKDIVIRGGENIPVVDVENMLYKHPAIKSVALVGAPDPRLGERLCAYVTLHDGTAQPLTLKDLTDYLLEQQLTRQYLPEYLEVMDELPRTPSGKIQKFKLREMAKELFLDRKIHA